MTQHPRAMLLIPSIPHGAVPCSSWVVLHTASHFVEAWRDLDLQGRSCAAARSMSPGGDKLPFPTSDVSVAAQTNQGPTGQVLGATQAQTPEMHWKSMGRTQEPSGQSVLEIQAQ